MQSSDPGASPTERGRDARPRLPTWSLSESLFASIPVDDDPREVEKSCEFCGISFEPGSPLARFCSSASRLQPYAQWVTASERGRGIALCGGCAFQAAGSGGCGRLNQLKARPVRKLEIDHERVFR